MKRVFLGIIIAAALAALLTACGQGVQNLPPVPAPEPEQEAAAQEQKTPEPPQQAAEAPQQEEEPAPLVEISALEAPLAEQPAEQKVSSGKKPSAAAAAVSAKEYYIKVDRKACVTAVYTRDETGAYTVLYKTMPCSTGKSTPLGTYKLPNAQWAWLKLVGGVYGQYCTQIKGNYLFHSVPYTARDDKGSLQWEEYDKLGTVCSHGCIRLSAADARWIYCNMEKIYRVEICEDADLPAPVPAMKISGNELCRGWDPTDPDENNPWPAWFAEQNTEPAGAEPESPEDVAQAPEDAAGLSPEVAGTEDAAQAPPEDAPPSPETDGESSAEAEEEAPLAVEALA